MSDPETQALQNQTQGDGALAGQSIRSVPIEQIEGQVKDIQKVMDSLMKEGTHYDDVTGGGRNSLLQPGAEKLCMAFKFAPSFDVERRDYAPDEVPNAKEPVEGHREYIVNCELRHRPTSQYVGSGRGSCSTLESKYRYRKIDQTTKVPIPGNFWDSYEDSMANADFSILEEELKASGVDMPDGAEAGVTKDDNGEWRITVQAKGENPDIADQYNTVLKMAEKRALVNAVKRSTAASDIFTQDTEDLAQLDGSNVQGQRKQTPSQSSGKAQRSGPSQGARPNHSGRNTNGHNGSEEKTAGSEVKTQKSDKWYKQATDWLIDTVKDGEAEASDVLANADSVPSEHPIDDWPDDYAEAATEHIKNAATDSGKAQGKRRSQAKTSEDTPKKKSNGSSTNTSKSESANSNGQPPTSDNSDKKPGAEEVMGAETAGESDAQDPDEVKEAAESVEVEGEDANAEEFEDGDGLPF
jgi:hypothetical protein